VSLLGQLRAEISEAAVTARGRLERIGSRLQVAARPEARPFVLLLLGMAVLVATPVLSESAPGLAQAALLMSVGLNSAGLVMAVLLRVLPAPAVGKEVRRFEALSQRLEHRLEKLKDLQWELSDNETRYRDLLDSQNDVITRVDMRGRLTFVNRAFCRTFGVEAGEVLGTPFKPVVLEREGEPDAPMEPGRRQRFEKLVLTADGARWFAFERQAITGEDGAVREVQLLGRDVTEQRLIQSTLAEARDQAEAANRAKSRFLAAMSHEIRTPMNGILGMVDLLSETELSSEQRTYVQAVNLSAKNLLTIIDEILDLSKIEAGKLEIHSAPFPLDECLQGVVELMAPRARERGIDLAWRIEPDLPRNVVGDETRVRQILLNLVGNAIKFTDSGGVAVRVRRARPAGVLLEGEMERLQRQLPIAFEVLDTGPGIAADQIGRLFAEFEQADDGVLRKRNGTGLGLAISRRLARAMQGDIEVTSAPGSGSVFVARLMLHAQPPARPVLVIPSVPLPHHVLLVSSRTQQRTLMLETLESLGIAAQAATPEAAFTTIEAARAAARPFDTLVLDVEMGAEAIAGQIGHGRAAAGGGRLRAIVVVDQPGGSRLEAFRSAGCDAYLVRPVRPVSLLAQIAPEIGLAARGNTAMPSKAVVPAEADSIVSGGRRVLLVEDNEINALLASRMSERAGCLVHHAASGHAALAWCDLLLAAGDGLDLVLLDIHMPEMDGFETSRRLRRLFADHGVVVPPIVALTANAFPEDRKRCLDAGLDDYLAKPFDRFELEALLEKWCASDRRPRDGSLGGCAA
jgi:PAS domain S-box-containing protein